MLGVAISVGCLMVPLVHIVSGPLGPAIGGFVSGTRVQASGRNILWIGLCIGSGVALTVSGVAGLLLLMAPGMWEGNGILETLKSGALFWGIVAIIWLYAGVLGSVGAWLGGRTARPD